MATPLQPPTFDTNETGVTVLGESGSRVVLTSLYRERRILLVFLRHFGCRFCRQQVAMLKLVQPTLRKHGVECVLISLGTSDQISQFKEEHDIHDWEVYVDPSPDMPIVYKAFRLRRGEEVMLANPKTLEMGEVALAEGFVDGGYPAATGEEYTGDVMHVGGVFLLGEGNVCDYAYRSSHAGDHPDPNELIEAVTGVRVEDGAPIVYPATASWLEQLGSGERAAPPPAQTLSPPRATARLALLVALGAFLCVPLGTSSWPASAGMRLIAVLLALATLATAVLACALPRPAAQPAAPHPEAAATALPSASRVPLLSPTEIDAVAVQRNLLQCDCARVTEATDLSSDWRVVEAAQPSAYAAAIGEMNTLFIVDALSSLVDGPADGGSAQVNAAVHQMRLANCYFRDFLAKSHPLLGRAGPTCPFVPKSLKLDTLRVGVVPTGAAPDPQQLRRLVADFIPLFEALEPTSGPTAVFKAIVLLFPDIPLHAAPQLIDGTQAALKEAFVERGLMLGEFHLLNNASGLHNPGFFPLRTVCPALAMRHMVPSDLVFLSGDQYPPVKRAAFLKSYVLKMGAEKGKKAQDEAERARAMLDELQKEL